MNVSIVKYNIIGLIIRSSLMIIGFGFILLGLLNKSEYTLYGKMFIICFLAWLTIKLFYKRYNLIGRLNLLDDFLSIDRENTLIKFSIPDDIKKIKFYRSGYKGELYDYHFSRVGMFAFKSGANRIQIETSKEMSYNFLIMIDEELELKRFVNLLNEYRTAGIVIELRSSNRFEI